MKPSLVSGCIISALLSLQAAAQESQLVFSGDATALDGGRALYEEQHRVSGTCENNLWRPEQHRVSYVRPGSTDGFASKELDYNGSLLRPAVDFHQPEFGERLQISVNDGTLDIEWSIEGERGGNWAPEITENLVVDAGFDHFIRKHWESLTSGEAAEFRFLAPTRGEAYGFIVEPSPEPIPGADHSLRIRPAGLIMRMAVDPIRLGYRDDGFLTHYVGLGNIRRNPDENYQVAIRYTLDSPPPCPLLGTP